MLILFTFIVYIAPQMYYPTLRSFRMGLVSAGLSMLLMVKNNRGNFYLNTEIKLMLLIGLSSVALIPFSIWPGGSFEYFTDQLVKSLILFVLLSFIINGIDKIQTIWIWLILFCYFHAFDAIRDYLAGDFIGRSNRITGGVSPITSNPNDLALTLVLVVPMAVSLLLGSDKKTVRLLCLGYLIISTIGIMCTYSRGGFLTLFVVYFLLVLKLTKRFGGKILLFSLIAIVIFLMLSPTEYIERLSSIRNFDKDTTGSATARWNLTIRGVELLLENPFTGVGLGMNILGVVAKGSGWHQVHNAYLQLGIELGVICLAFYLALIFRLINNMRVLQKDIGKNLELSTVFFMSQGIEVSLIAFSIAAFFHPVAYHFYFYYIAGFAASLKRIYSLANRTELKAQ